MDTHIVQLIALDWIVQEGKQWEEEAEEVEEESSGRSCIENSYSGTSVSVFLNAPSGDSDNAHVWGPLDLQLLHWERLRKPILLTKYLLSAVHRINP